MCIHDKEAAAEEYARGGAASGSCSCGSLGRCRGIGQRAAGAPVARGYFDDKAELAEDEPFACAPVSRAASADQ